MAQKRRRKKRTSPWKVLFRIIVTLSALVVAIYIAFSLVAKPPEIAQADNPENNETFTAPNTTEAGQKERKKNTYTFLLTASDDGNGNADTLIVATYDVKNEHLGMVSIPRDTIVETNRKIPKINAAFGSGMEVLISEVSHLLGFPIDFYARVDMQAFIDLIDAVGGIDFNVPVEMYYHDPKQDLTIRYMPGLQHLSGQQAMEVARFRKNGDGTGYPDSDIGRTQTQQAMLSTIADKLLSWNSLSRIKAFVKIFQDNVDTNLSYSDMLYFASEGMDLDLNHALRGATLPGDGTKRYKGLKWCYDLDDEAALILLNEFVNPYTTPLTLDDVNFVDIP